MHALTRQIVVVCFGTPSISGDSLGPEVGSLLREDERFPAYVYGTLDRPITGRNMSEWISFVEEAHRDALFVSVDACLGDRRNLGKISVRSDGVCPAAVGGRKKRFGDVGIIAVVGDKTKDALSELMQVNAVYVSELALKVSDMIKAAVSSLDSPAAVF